MLWGDPAVQSVDLSALLNPVVVVELWELLSWAVAAWVAGIVSFDIITLLVVIHCPLSGND